MPTSAAMAQADPQRNGDLFLGTSPNRRADGPETRRSGAPRQSRTLSPLVARAPGPQCFSIRCSPAFRHAPWPAFHLCYIIWLYSPDCGVNRRFRQLRIHLANDLLLGTLFISISVYFYALLSSFSLSLSRCTSRGPGTSASWVRISSDAFVKFFVYLIFGIGTACSAYVVVFHAVSPFVALFVMIGRRLFSALRGKGQVLALRNSG